MNEIFKSIEEAKQQRILNAAYEEFSSQGYTKASTNRIIKKAEISKGMLFYYFNNKQELFEDLVDIGIEYLQTNFFELIDEAESDFIKKYYLASRIKLQALHQHRYLFEFLGNIYLHGDEDKLSAEAMHKMKDWRETGMSRIYNNIDTSLFRTDLPKERVMKLIIRCIGGYERELTEQFKMMDWTKVDLQVYWDEFDVFLEDLRKVFYNPQNI